MSHYASPVLWSHLQTLRLPERQPVTPRTTSESECQHPDAPYFINIDGFKAIGKTEMIQCPSILSYTESWSRNWEFHLSVTVSCSLVAWQRSRLGGLPLWFGYCGIAPALSAAESEQGQHHPKLGSTWSSGAARPHNTVNIFTNIHISKIYHAEFSFRINKYACKWLMQFLFLPVTPWLDC